METTLEKPIKRTNEVSYDTFNRVIEDSKRIIIDLLGHKTHYAFDSTYSAIIERVLEISHEKYQENNSEYAIIAIVDQEQEHYRIVDLHHRTTHTVEVDTKNGHKDFQEISDTINKLSNKYHPENIETYKCLIIDKAPNPCKTNTINSNNYCTLEDIMENLLVN